MPRRLIVTVVTLNAAVQPWSQSWLMEMSELDATVEKIWAAHASGHVVFGVSTTFQMSAGLLLPNVLGTVVNVTSIDPFLLDGTASIVTYNVLATNGVVHTTDTVLDPNA
jgi:hypothetical protein